VNKKDKSNTNGAGNIGNINGAPQPLNPDDPLNAFAYSIGGGKDRGFNIYPGIDGIPHRAKGVRYYKNNDPSSMRPKSGGQVRCMIFNMGDAKDRVNFEQVVSRVYTMQQSGKAVVCAIDRQFVAEEKTWFVYYEWIESFTYDSTGPSQASYAQYDNLRRRS